MKKIGLLFLSILVFLFFLPNSGFASEPTEFTWECHASTCACTARCVLGCDNRSQRRRCWREGEHCECSPWETVDDCQSWQQCNGGMTCYCHGPCIDTPRDPRYFNNPNFPTDPLNPNPKMEKNRDSRNILLPVKLDWGDVRGWIRGWREEPAGCFEDGHAPHHGRCVKSYKIKIYDTTKNIPSKRYFLKTLDKSEFIPPPCLLRSITEHNWRVRGCCSIDGQNCDDEWSNWSFKTNPAPEIRSIFGDPQNRILDYITRNNDKLPDQFGGLFPINPDPDWKYPEIKREGNLMPPIVIDWCPIDKEMEVNGVETERKRLQRKTKEMLINRMGYKADHKFPDGFRTKYKIAFYECKEKQGGECIKWKPYHFRYEGLIGRLVNYTLIFFKQREKTIFPDFFLDQNRFFLTYDTKYRVTIRRCGHIYQKGREIHDGEGLFCFGPSQAWHFKTEGNAYNLGETRILKPVSIFSFPYIQSLPFRAKFENIPGANYYKFMISRLGVHLGLIVETGFIRDNRPTQPLDAHFRPYNPPPAIKSDLVFTYPGGGGDVFLKLDQLYSLYLNSCLTDRAYLAVDGSIVGKDCDPMPTEVRFRTPGSRATNLRITSGWQNGKAIIPVTFEWNRPTGVRSFRVDLLKGGVFKRNFVTRANNITIGYPDLVLGQNYKIKVWSCVDEYGKVCVDRFGGNIIRGLLGYRGDEYARLLPSPLFNTFILKPPTGLDVFPEGDEVVPPIAEGQVKTEDFIRFDWKPVYGATFYQIEIRNPHRTITRIVDTNNLRIHQRYLVETGNYTWKVRACIDKECKKQGETTGDWSQTASFHLLPPIEKEEGAWYGLVVCGLLIDNPATGWNDREACTIRHIPLTIYVIIDFILWRVVPLIMVLLIILTAFFYYTAFANAEEIDQITPKVKKMWKNFAIGFFILFFGFTIINIFLGIINFNVDIFGRWYEI